MISGFKDLNIKETLLKGLSDMGFEQPTLVQSEAIPIILDGHDVVVKSKTGSGKTATFGIPIFEKITVDSKLPKALILTPTRELAVQVNSELSRISKYEKVKTTAVYGQHNIGEEMTLLEKGVSVVTGTPGRVNDHIKQGTLKTSQIAFLVIDEADKMLDMGFIDQVVTIIKALPKDRTTLLFSATMPLEIQGMCKSYMKDPLTIEMKSETETVDTIHQIYHKVDRHEKRLQLKRVLLFEKPKSCMIFCNTRATVDRVCEDLHRKGYAVEALHGAITQNRRLKTINRFKSGDFSILVATDVAARGIHVNDLSLVINYDIPLDNDSYVHRIGRTGRAGSGGKAISLVTSDDVMTLYEIEEHIGVMIEEVPLPSEEVLRKKKNNPISKEKPREMIENKRTPQRVVVVGANAPELSRQVTSQNEVANKAPAQKKSRFFTWFSKLFK